jgi:hypothetical protein
MAFVFAGYRIDTNKRGLVFLDTKRERTWIC